MGNKSSSHNENDSGEANNRPNGTSRRTRTTTRRGTNNQQSNQSNESNRSEEPPKPSYWQLIRGGYDELVHAIIRPPRAEYSVDMLGPAQFILESQIYVREDFQLQNERGHTLECSYWKPQHNSTNVQPCIIYLHGNASCRAEALECLPIVLSSGLSLLAFDFSGSGMSGGDYISLGYFEKDDVQTVIQHMRSSGKASVIGLWGRSMGAVTALMHADRDPSIACLILDSPFTSLKQLAKELVEHAQLSVPKWAVGFALKFVRSSVKSRAGFDIYKLEPINHANRCFVPAFFGAAEEDNFIRPHHSQQLHDVYGGSKNIVLFPGDHNTARPSFYFHSVSIFLQNTMVSPFGIGALSNENGVSTEQVQVETSNNEWTKSEVYNMPAPLSSSGAGLGINVGIPSMQPGEGERTSNFSDPFNETIASQEEAYFDALLNQAIAVSLAEATETNKTSNNNETNGDELQKGSSPSNSENAANSSIDKTSTEEQLTNPKAKPDSTTEN